MTPKTKPIPDGFHTLTPHIVVRDAAKAIEFYKKAFSTKVKNANSKPDRILRPFTMKFQDVKI